ncbi:IucA/IucC family protein [Fulvimarina sp. MAC3]|uniref:IucA/IucC family protein n=1 Tax=Fulvimarina sp. MAC3 TaxID=3148887 RepID=UPI0031FCF3C8
MTLVLDGPGPDGPLRRVLAQLLSAALFEGLLSADILATSAIERAVPMRTRIGYLNVDFRVLKGAFGRYRILPESVRIGGGKPDRNTLLAVLAGLRPNPARLDDLTREFSRTVSGLAAATDRAPKDRRALACDPLDAAIYEGHPYHPAFRGRLGFSAEDDRAFGPETCAAFKLHWCLVRKERLSEAGTIANSPDRWADFAGQEVAAAAQAQAGRDTADWRLLPIHPWQWHRHARDLLAPAAALGDLHHLGQIGAFYGAGQSLRTLFNLERPQSPHLKLPLDVVNTSVPRTLEPHWALAAPALSDWFERLVGGDPWLSENRRLVALKETSAAVFERHLSSAEQIGLIRRENPAKAVEAGESAVPLNALMTIEKDGDPFIQPWIERYGVRAFADRLIEVVVLPFLHLLVAHGVAAEAHGQNVVLVHRDGWPVRIALRDFSDNLEWVPDFLWNVPPLPDFEAIDRVFADPTPNRFYWMETLEDLRWLFMDAVLIFSISEISFLLERRYGLPEAVFFETMAVMIKDHVRAFGLDDRFLRLGLDAGEIVTDRLLASKLGRDPTWPLRVENPLARTLSGNLAKGAAA